MARLPHLSRLQWVVLCLITVAVAIVVANILTEIQQANWGQVIAWGTVLLGLGLTWLAIDDVEYFLAQERLIGNSWLIRIFTRSGLTLTVIASYFTVARIVTLLLGVQVVIQVLSSLAIIWLLFIVRLMRIEFQSHEGRKQ